MAKASDRKRTQKASRSVRAASRVKEPASSTRAARPQITKANYEALADFRFALRRFFAFSETAARAAGLTAQQHQALLTIKGAPDGRPVTIRELAQQLLVQHNTAVELVDRLVEAGLVQRSRDEADRRRALIAPTPAAERLLESLSAAHLEELQSIRPVLLKLLKHLG
jgi:DNA-binding MarR family transcriptional regulator